MTGYTQPDRLPYPDDYNTGADSPTAIRDLATETQAALVSRHVWAGNGMWGGGATHLDPTLNVGQGWGIDVVADAVAVNANALDTRYSQHGHAHTPTAVGLLPGLHNFGSLTPGQESTHIIPIGPNDIVLATVDHPSSWIALTANLDYERNECDIKVRNTTQSTTHNDVRVSFLVVAR